MRSRLRQGVAGRQHEIGPIGAHGALDGRTQPRLGVDELDQRPELGRQPHRPQHPARTGDREPGHAGCQRGDGAGYPIDGDRPGLGPLRLR